jgi:hypothetical protein
MLSQEQNDLLTQTGPGTGWVGCSEVIDCQPFSRASLPKMNARRCA